MALRQMAAGFKSGASMGAEMQNYKLSVFPRGAVVPGIVPPLLAILTLQIFSGQIPKLSQTSELLTLV